MNRVAALLWDVDGTLAETERDGHRPSFNDAFASLGLTWHWDEARYGELLRITGGRERILLDMARRTDAPVTQGEREQLARELHQRKNKAYAERLAQGSIALRPGVAELIDEAARRGLRQAIVTTTSRSNLAALLRHAMAPELAQALQISICGEDVAAKKPDPEAYRRALAALALQPLATVALEDTPSGVASARGADVPVIVTRSAYFPDDTVEGVLAVGPGLHSRAGWHPSLPGAVADQRVTLDDVLDWHARMEKVSQFG